MTTQAQTTNRTRRTYGALFNLQNPSIANLSAADQIALEQNWEAVRISNSIRTPESWRGAPVAPAKAAHLLHENGFSSQMEKLAYQRYGVAEMVLSTISTISTIPQPATPRIQNRRVTKTCVRCGSGTMFTTIAGGDICDDCI